MSKFIRYIVLVGIFLIPFIPLVVVNSFFFPFITGKGFAFRVLIEIIFGLWTILAVTDRNYRPRLSWVFWPLIAFTAVMFLADAHSIYPYKSFWSNYERMEGYITLIHLFAYFIVVSTVLKTTRLWNWFWNTSIIVSIFIAIYGFLQLAGKLTINQGGVRLDATFGNATYLAIYAVFHIFLIAYILVSDDMFFIWPTFTNAGNKIAKMVGGLFVILLELIILYHTATRGAILGLIVGLGLAALLVALFDRTHQMLRKVSMGIVVAAIVVVLAFISLRHAAFVQNSPVLKRFASISLNDPTTESRFILWNMAWQGFKERPLLGWGQESFNYVFNKYYDPRLYNQEQWFDRTHNVIFDWLIAGGILGLATYLWFFGAIIWYTWKKSNFNVAEKSLITGLLTAYFIHNLFVFDNLISYILYFSIAAFVHTNITRDQYVAGEAVAPNRIIVPAAIVCTVLVIYAVNWNAYQQNLALISSISPHATSAFAANLPYGGDLSTNVSEFERTLNYHSFGTPEAREQLIAMADNITTNAAQVKGGSDLLSLATDQAAIQASTTPHDARYLLLAGALQSRVNNLPDAISYLKQAVQESPRKQTIMFELGSAYLAAKDSKNAEDTLRQAYELDTDYDDAKLFYAVSAIYNKDMTTANKLIATMPKDTVMNSDAIVNAYVSAGENQAAIDLLKARVAADPENPQKHISLAAAYYLLLKDKKDAIIEIRKAETLYPAFKAQGEDYIKKIEAGLTP